jgi:hypothetical protein
VGLLVLSALYLLYHSAALLGPGDWAIRLRLLLTAGCAWAWCWMMWRGCRLRRLLAIPCYAVAAYFAALILVSLGEAVLNRKALANLGAVALIGTPIVVLGLVCGRALWRGSRLWQIPAALSLAVGFFMLSLNLMVAQSTLGKSKDRWMLYLFLNAVGLPPLLVGGQLWRQGRRQTLSPVATPTEGGFYVTGGTLPSGAPSYVERPADAALTAALLRGEFCYVLTSRQMGKSSLMVRTATRLREAGVAVAVLDLTMLGQNLTAEQWYGGLLGLIGQSLGLEDELERVLYWTGGHPYLTQRLCQALAERKDVRDPDGVDQLCEALFLAPGARERDDNLQFTRNELLKREAIAPGLLRLYGHVRAGYRVPDDAVNRLVGQLRLTGVTRSEGGFLRVRNRIYQHLFDRRWVREHLSAPGTDPEASGLPRERPLALAGALSPLGLSRKALRLGLVGGVAALIALAAATTTARQARWAAARAEENRQVWCECALMRLALGNTEGYRQACRHLLDQWDISRNPNTANAIAWTCALVPNAVPDLNRPVQLSEAALAQGGDQYEYLNTLGATLYRAGRFDEAIRTLHRAIERQGHGGTAYDHLFLAMAYQRLGDTGRAAQSLEQAVLWIKQTEAPRPSGRQTASLSWTERLELRLLRREAESMVGPHRARLKPPLSTPPASLAPRGAAADDRR